MDAIFSRETHLRHMLAFEAALARAEAATGVIPGAAAEAIAAAASSLDAGQLLADSGDGPVAVTAMVRALTAAVPPEARGYVHWATTTQDVVDTATVLQMRDGLDVLERELRAVGAACATLAERHRATPMPGRTFLQHATPITFGLKAARWLAMVVRQVHRLRRVRDDEIALQLGGASGTLAPLGDRGGEVAVAVGRELRLPVPDLPWHAERDRVANIAGAVGVVAGAMSKISGDVLLLGQSEIAEAAEAAGGGSSTMPQKRNPTDSVAAIAAARLAQAALPVILAAMAHEHERAVGGWQTEWVAVPDLFRHTGRAVVHVRRLLETLEVDVARMRSNLELGGGLVMAEALSFALAATIGRHEAYPIVRDLADRVRGDGVDLRRAAQEDPRVRATLDAAEIDRALDPLAYLGSTELFVDRALAAYRAF